MTTTARLTDLQSLLLSHASRSDYHAFEPLPEKLRDQEARVRLSLRSLVKRGLAGVHTVLPEDGGPATVEVLATSAGLEAIGCDSDATAGAADDTVSPAPEADEVAATNTAAEPPGLSTPSAATPVKPGSRAAQLLELLARDQGVTIPVLSEATGTLPHSVRAALTGLRKKGHAITSAKVDGKRRYSVAAGQ